MEYMREDIGGVDYWFHHWWHCMNPACKEETEKIPEEFERGSY